MFLWIIQVIEDFQKLHENEERIELQLELEEAQRQMKEARKDKEEARKAILEADKKVEQMVLDVLSSLKWWDSLSHNARNEASQSFQHDSRPCI